MLERHHLELATPATTPSTTWSRGGCHAFLLRQRRAFEQAEIEADPVERERLMTFVVIGGGPTGVEMAGAIADTAHFSLA